MLNIFSKVFRRTVDVQLNDNAIRRMHSIAAQAMPSETGGILIGWWEGQKIVVDSVEEVVDALATGNSWVRHEREAQKALNATLNKSSDFRLGYVGDWHSHPAPVGASGTDLVSLSCASKQYKKPLVLIIRLSDGSVDVRVANKGRLLSVELT